VKEVRDFLHPSQPKVFEVKFSLRENKRIFPLNTQFSALENA